MRYLAAYLTAGLTFGLIDAAWLTVMGPRLYRPVLGAMMLERPSLAPALAFYLIYLGGVVALAVAPALKDGGWSRAALSGAILGLVAYGTYDLTNQATLKLWTTRLTLIDLSYGLVLTAVAATAAFHAAQWTARALPGAGRHAIVG
jgi:uncharacterized membrane protein